MNNSTQAASTDTHSRFPIEDWDPRLRAVAIALTVTLAVALTFAGLRLVGVLSDRGSGASSMASAKAQEILEQVLAQQPHGRATSAAFVETTNGEYEASLPKDERLTSGTVPDSDRVIIVEVTGTFPSAHRGLPGENTDADRITTVYDEESGDTLVTRFSQTAPANPNASGAPIVPPTILSRIGTPEPLTIP